MAAPAEQLDRFLQAIADPTRRGILHALKEKGKDSLGRDAGLSASEIEQWISLAQPTVSHHMKILEKAQLVVATRDGHWRRYRRNEKLIREMTKHVRSQL
jgi:ArsR family transcriptional regulator